MNLNHSMGTIHQVRGATLYGPFFTVSGNNAAWTKHIVPLGMFAGLEVNNGNGPQIIFKYTSGSSFRGDVQIDELKLGNIWHANTGFGSYVFRTYDSNRFGSSYLQTTTTNTSSFFSASWTAMTTSTTSGRWNRDCSGTPSSGTGLTSGALTSSCYWYVEVSSFFNSTAWLKVIPYQLNYSVNTQDINKSTLLPTSYVEFYEARYGSDMGTLEMYVYVPDDDYY